jgi:MerR family mercuric resistance operon transcriptional regulator
MLTRGKLSKLTGCNAETIRYYERTGLLKEPERSSSGYRLYDEEHVKSLSFIQRAKHLGFSTDRIRSFLELYGDRNLHTRAEVKQLTEKHIQEVTEKIRDLTKLKNSLSQISSHCDGSGQSAESCPILVSLFDEI